MIGSGGRPVSWTEYGPGSDGYRGDWDVYDRERGYYDRGAYDYGRRGRSRSPGPEDGTYLTSNTLVLHTHSLGRI